MRTQDIVIGEFYRHRTDSHIGYAKALKIIKPIAKYKQAYSELTEEEKTIKCVVVKCEWTKYKNDKETGGFVFIKYFRPCDLIKCEASP